MKFKKLQIHNIASIEDATIDFNQQPLAGSEVFLITGKTGAGKSTLLDAICLAIYGDTPRLNSTLMKGDTTDAGLNVAVNDVRQLMRRNTGEAWVTLWFEGSNGIDYESSWSIARARNKVEGRLQPVRRSLTRLSDGTTYTKKQDIEPEIAAAVGLDFNQFCRTTMLAQGQFTQFLNSNDKDKAAILEKITGVDAYTKIGKKVYEVTKEKELRWIDAQKRTEGVKVLTDEETELRKQEEKLLTERHNELATQRKALIAKQEWICKCAELNEQAKQAKAAYDLAQAQWDSKDVAAQRLLVAQWNETTEVRGWLADMARSAEEAQAAAKELEAKKYVFAMCMAAQAATEKQLADARQELTKASESIASSKEKDQAIEQAQTILGHLKSIAQDRLTIKKHEDGIKLLSEQIKDLEKEWSGKMAKAEKLNEALSKSQKTLQEAEAKACNFPMEQLRKESAALAQRMAYTGIANERFAAWDEAKKHAANELKAIADLEKNISALNKSIEAKKPEVEKAKSLVTERERALKQLVATVEEWTKKLRADLVVGGLCPVCRQHVAEIPHNDVLDELHAQAESACKAANEACQKLDNELKSLQNSLMVNTQLHNERVESHNADTSLAKAEKAVKEILEKLEIVETGDEAKRLLNTLKEQLKLASEANEATIRQGEDAEKLVKERRKEHEEARAACEQAKTNCDSTQKKIDDQKAKVKTAQELIEQKNKDIDTAAENISALLADSGKWANDWRTEGMAFAAELSAVANERKLLNDKVANLTSGTARVEEMLQRVADSMSAIGNLCPTWKDLPQTTEGVNGLEATVSQLHRDVAKWAAQLNKATQDKADLEQKVQKYIADSEQYTREMLEALCGHNRMEIAILTEELNNLKLSFDKAKILVDNNSKLREAHEAKRPELTGEDSTENLSAQLQQLEHTQAEQQQRLGAIKQELNANEKVKEQLKALLGEVELAQKEYERWDRMNRLIGSATGDVFRRIAQSYVLAELIHAANHYMKTLSPRYTLHVQAGSFVIAIEDAYQGYARRAVSTISGGESFLVSLSLALALSDIGQHLSVDTLFIDEGFGTLSGEPLQNAIGTLRMLHSRMGRHVGIISHVDELQERIPVQIKVEQEGNSSSSKVSVVQL